MPDRREVSLPEDRAVELLRDMNRLGVIQPGDKRSPQTLFDRLVKLFSSDDVEAAARRAELADARLARLLNPAPPRQRRAPKTPSA